MFSVRNVGLVSSFKRNSLDIAFESTHAIKCLVKLPKLKISIYLQHTPYFQGEKIPKKMHYPLNSPFNHLFCGKSAL